jgi:hypothetical protein
MRSDLVIRYKSAESNQLSPKKTQSAGCKVKEISKGKKKERNPIPPPQLITHQNLLLILPIKLSL